MSLIINADTEYLSGTGGAFGTNLTQATFAIWVKRDAANSSYQGYGKIAPDVSVNENSITLNHNGIKADCFAYPGANEYRIDNAGDTNSTAWQLFVLTYKQTDFIKLYTAITGGSVISTNDNFVSNEYFNATLSQVRIGYGYTDWFARCRLAHCAFWNTELTASQVSELFNGGAGGAGKNPQAIASSNLTFYAPLTTDGSVTVGGITLSPTGTITYDAAENPNVESLTSSTNITVWNVVTTNTVSPVAISTQATGSLTTLPLKNNTGTVLANETGATAYVYNITSGALVVAKTGQSTNASGVMTINDVLIVKGTQYRVVVKLASAAEGLDKITAA
jgi:hypothetical protein